MQSLALGIQMTNIVLFNWNEQVNKPSFGAYCVLNNIHKSFSGCSIDSGGSLECTPFNTPNRIPTDEFNKYP